MTLDFPSSSDGKASWQDQKGKFFTCADMNIYFKISIAFSLFSVTALAPNKTAQNKYMIL